MLQTNFELTGEYTKSQISNVVTGLPSNRLPQTNIAAQLLPSGNQLSTSDGVPEESIESLASFQTPGDSGVELETAFKQLLTLELEADEPSKDDSVTTPENLDLANLPPLIEAELAKKLDASNASILMETGTLHAATVDSRLRDQKGISAGDASSPASLAKPVSRGIPTFKPHPQQVAAGLASPEVGASSFEIDLVSLDAGSLSFEVPPSAFDAGSSLFGMPPPASGEFDLTAANHVETFLDAEVPNQMAPALAHAVKPAAPVVSPATVPSPSEITQTVVDNLVQEVQLAVNGEHKRLTLQLHPAELGQVSLQLDWENESLKLKIISNEMLTSEILSQNKTELVAMLAEQGIDFESLDLSFESPTSEDESQQKKSNSQSLDPTMFASDSTVEDVVQAMLPKGDASGLDITI